MGLNKSFDRAFHVIGGAVKTTGGSLNLVKGQVALVDGNTTTKDGAKVLGSLAGIPKNHKFLEIRTGIDERKPNRSVSNKPQATMPFSLNDIVDLKVSVPQKTEQSVDEVILGYNGINDETSFNLGLGESYKRITVELEGDALSYLGGGLSKETISVNFEVPRVDVFNDCDDTDACGTVDCKEWTLNVIETLKAHQLTGGTPLGEVIDITPVFSCDNGVEAEEIPYVFYSLVVCDTGDAEALALVQAQYDVPVKRIKREGVNSTYQLLIPESDASPADFEKTIASILKGCEDCPDGYSELTGGYVYAIAIEDDGADLTTTIETLANAVSGSAIKASGSDAGLGFYTVVLTAVPTDAQINTFLTAGAPRNTATLENLGKVESLCVNGTTEDIAWVEGDSCNVIEQVYLIDLPDNKCGEDRLAELQTAYKDLTIGIAGESSIAVVVTGTSGTANITINGQDYLVTFNTDLPTTASDFVTAHASNILAAHNVTVSVGGNSLTFSYNNINTPTISTSNLSGDLAGNLGATQTITSATGGCQTTYFAKTISNMVCEECDDVFYDAYVTEAPEDYDVYAWYLDTVNNDAATPNTNCKCGIRFKSKPFILSTGECFRDKINFVEDSVRIRVSGGYPEEIREGIGKTPKEIFPVTILSKFEPRTHLGGHLQDFEEYDRYYFENVSSGDALSRYLRGQESAYQDQLKQYADYALTISHFSHSQGFAGRLKEDITYHFYVEIGRTGALENLLNSLASAAGLTPVQAVALP